MKRTEVTIVGGGIVGLATARALLLRDRAVRLIEAEREVGRHQTGHNSGVIHAGVYYKPGSLKARLSTEGRERIYRFCSEHEIPHERCGKLIVATAPDEIPRLEQLEQRARANGLTSVRRLTAEQIAEIEPHARGVAGLFVPETGIVDFKQVAAALRREVERLGGELALGSRFVRAELRGGELTAISSAEERATSLLINCAGLEADRVARACGLEPEVRIVPFRGDYCALLPERRGLVRNLIYPVPDPAFPFLGVHLTRRIDGEIEAGPNAVLALSRRHYGRFGFDLGDAASALGWGGSWRLMARHWQTGIAELYRAQSLAAFARALSRLVPEIERGDLVRAGCGLRAQAVDRDGRLCDDFQFQRGPRMLHVLNAPSPAATASLAIAETIADTALLEWA